LISPVQSEPALEFQAPSLRSFGYQGKQFGYPYAAENIALICNSNEVSTQPTDWSQVATNQNPLPVLENGDPYSLYALQASFGASVFLQDELGDDLAKLNFNSPGGSAFANWLGENAGSFKLQSSQAAVTSFINNEANCLLGGPWLIPQLGDAIPLAIYDVPALRESPATSFLTTRGFFITQASSAKETAELFLSEYLASVEFQKLAYLTSGQQPVTEAFLGAIDSSTTRGFVAAANTAVPLPTLDQLSQIWFEWGLAQVKIIQGASDPDVLWSEMAQNLASSLGLE
jgi:arabinogalactan oligomer/maltooligosaccharide transport system substrate-binding protein